MTIQKILEAARDRLSVFQFCTTPEGGLALLSSLREKLISPEADGTFSLTKRGEKVLNPPGPGKVSTNSLILPLSQEVVDRFWAKVKIGQPNECWLWIGSKDTHGYGQISIQRFPRKATRIALILDGRNPGTLCALHKCDNPPCVNPAHLFVGTKAENTADMLQKSRHRTDPVRGEDHYEGKLTDEDVRAIRREAAAGVLQRVLAKKFGVDRTMISCIVLRKNWRHVDD